MNGHVVQFPCIFCIISTLITYLVHLYVVCTLLHYTVASSLYETLHGIGYRRKYTVLIVTAFCVVLVTICCLFILFPLNCSRVENLDAEVLASGFTREMQQSLDQVLTIDYN